MLAGLRVKARMEVPVQSVALNKAGTNCGLLYEITFIVVLE
jgi:hypothetical protein